MSGLDLTHLFTCMRFCETPDTSSYLVLKVQRSSNGFIHMYPLPDGIRTLVPGPVRVIRCEKHGPGAQDRAFKTFVPMYMMCCCSSSTYTLHKCARKPLPFLVIIIFAVHGEKPSESNYTHEKQLYCQIIACLLWSCSCPCKQCW